MRRPWLPAASLGLIAAAMVLSIACLIKVTPITGLVFAVLGAPLFVLGVAGCAIVVFVTLRDHGVL